MNKEIILLHHSLELYLHPHIRDSILETHDNLYSIKFFERIDYLSSLSF